MNKLEFEKRVKSCRSTPRVRVRRGDVWVYYEIRVPVEWTADYKFATTDGDKIDVGCVDGVIDGYPIAEPRRIAQPLTPSNERLKSGSGLPF